MIKETLENNENRKLNDNKIAILKENFPNCFSGNMFDIEKFKKEINQDVDFSSEGYELDFLGKNYAKYIADSIDTETVLTPNMEHNKLDENKKSENIYITGDNLEVLKHLKKSYSNMIKVIYIDPPYNTGKDEFVYKDNFEFTSDELMELLDIEKEEAERIFNLTSTNSSSHSAWLTFMFPRLYLARELLKDEGVIIISIDDNQQAQLKLICDDIFGEENFIGSLPTIMNLKGNQDEFGFAGTHEYTIVYSKNKKKTYIGGFEVEEEELEEWKKDSVGYYKKGANLKSTGTNAPRTKRPYLYYPILINNETDEITTVTDEEYSKIYNPESETFDDLYVEKLRSKYEKLNYGFLLPITNDKKMSWRWSRDKVIKDAKEIILSDNKQSIYKKQRPELGDLPSKKPKTIFYRPQYSSGNGTSQVEEIFGVKIFDNPKPIELIKDFLKITTTDKDIVLDFFSGSGTTGHAVMELNVERLDQECKIKYILANLDEPVKKGSEAENAGYKTIDEIGRERIKRVAKKIKEKTNANIDYGFKHYYVKVISEESIENIKKFNPNLPIDELIVEFDIETILTTWMNQDGHGLNPKVKEIKFEGYIGYLVDSYLYFVDQGFNQKHIDLLMVKLIEDKNFNPTNIIIYGYNFKEYHVLEQLELNLKQLRNEEKNIEVSLIKRY